MSKTSPSNVGGAGLNPDQRAKIPHALGQREKNPKQKKQKKYCNKFNEDFKHGPHQDFPGGTVGKNMPANAGDMGSIPGP